jgi:hypothetical protein
MRKQLLTDNVMAQIPRWISERRLSPAEIANKIGCTIGSLRVRCSNHGISLRGRPNARRPFGSDDFDVAVLHACHQSSVRHSNCSRLKERATMMGVSESELVTMLIETIDKDDLYTAILNDAHVRTI